MADSCVCFVNVLLPSSGQYVEPLESEDSFNRLLGSSIIERLGSFDTFQILISRLIYYKYISESLVNGIIASKMSREFMFLLVMRTTHSKIWFYIFWKYTLLAPQN